MNFNSLENQPVQRQIPKTETFAKQFLQMRSIGDSQSESTLQNLIEETYNVATASLKNRPPLGKISNAARGEIIAAVDGETTPYALALLAKKAVTKAVKSFEQPS